MKVIKFKSHDPKQKAFEIALKENVNAYFKTNGISIKGNYKMYIKAFVFLSTYVAPFVILLTVPMSGLMALLLVFLMGFGEAGIGMSVMHDAAHGAFSSKKWVNTFFSSTMYILGSNTFNWKVQHNILHHTFTNIYGYDQDIETKALIRLSDHASLKKVHRFQFVYAFLLYGLMTLSKLFTDFGQLIDFNKSGITSEQNSSPRKEILKLIITKIIYGSIILGLPFFLTDYSWWQILLGFVILHLTAGIIMSTVFQMAHVVEGAEQPLPDENGIINNEWVVHELITTSNFAKNNFLLNWYVGGLNFQIEHHLFSHICHIHYRNISPIVEKTANEFGFKYNSKPSFLNALGSHIRRLKDLGR
jgi:linoleoyl-CoA desaturase